MLFLRQKLLNIAFLLNFSLSPSMQHSSRESLRADSFTAYYFLSRPKHVTTPDHVTLSGQSCSPPIGHVSRSGQSCVVGDERTGTYVFLNGTCSARERKDNWWKSVHLLKRETDRVCAAGGKHAFISLTPIVACGLSPLPYY